MLGGITMKRMK